MIFNFMQVVLYGKCVSLMEGGSIYWQWKLL